mmetsp:Transcript_141387/g.439419  ORF Transcript_141387/g.439419 Transcript_141387/m.439419 type:complete len:131 (+) Transcript_141387:636-1028(+)
MNKSVKPPNSVIAGFPFRSRIRDSVFLTTSSMTSKHKTSMLRAVSSARVYPVHTLQRVAAVRELREVPVEDGLHLLVEGLIPVPAGAAAMGAGAGSGERRERGDREGRRGRRDRERGGGGPQPDWPSPKA